jgi:hypothetical protein
VEQGQGPDPTSGASDASSGDPAMGDQPAAGSGSSAGAAPAGEASAGGPASDPVVHWETSPSGGQGDATGLGTGELLHGRAAGSLTLSDAITTGFTVVSKPTFILPILVIGVVVNTVVSAVFSPIITSTVGSGQAGDLSGAQIGSFVGAAFASVILAIIGGVLLNLYGQIWAVAATSGPLPSVGAVFEALGGRWISMIGTGIVVGVIGIGLLLAVILVSAITGAIVGALGILVALAGVVLSIWVGARLSQASWLAASGASVSEAINGSWKITENNLLRIIGWGIAYGIVFAIIGVVLSAILGLVPVIGPAIAQSINAAFGYGAGVVLFRRTQAAAAVPVPSTEAPAASSAA